MLTVEGLAGLYMTSGPLRSLTKSLNLKELNQDLKLQLFLLQLT